MPERSDRHEPLRTTNAPVDNGFEKRGGYPAPKTPFELPEVPSGPAQGAPSEAQSQTGTTSQSND
ncbi:hypothetical protein ACFQ68_07420 [Amycolatopsis japonica]|uniref:hypothetical protein n=1 Tax=Amycolatopsis japonica TaxID=208439 RepID=UPI00366BFF48